MIRAFGKANYEEQRFDEANKDYTQTAIKVNTIVALMIPLMTLIMSGTILQSPGLAVIILRKCN